ncbi:C2 calcium-dependent membrane targeting [Artemisia annua]|uniref:C2 calcium-dependent membrane targeting n=1 Tax=Artemisia annua TaxID=35608 RepID=A0A2U1PPV0_ARTAN|nr:C2 calcium-dependent membrane targeting [Artemisia annua]
MECRTLDLTLRSARSLGNKSIFGKSDVYAVVSISGTHSKLRTSVDKHGGSEPTWNYPMKLTIDEALGQQNRLNLVIKIKTVGIFGDRTVGQVEVPIKELMEGIKDDGKAMQETSYQIRRKSGKSKGYVSFSYKFGEKFIEPVTAYPVYPPGFAAGSGSAYPAQPKAGYANPYQQQQPVYGGAPLPPQGYAGYPPPQPVYAQAPLPQRGRFGGAGLGTGLLGGALGGLLIGDMISHGGGGCGGGGCGGGGCGGGGCGGGGCGG